MALIRRNTEVFFVFDLLFHKICPDRYGHTFEIVFFKNTNMVELNTINIVNVLYTVYLETDIPVQPCFRSWSFLLQNVFNFRMSFRFRFFFLFTNDKNNDKCKIKSF